MSHPKKREQAIHALLTTPNVTAAAEAVGVSPRTLFRWLRDDAFAARLEAARKQTFEHSLRRLASLMERALDTIESILGDTHATNKDKLRAAALVLNHGQASELSDTLRQLEAQLSQMENGV